MMMRGMIWLGLGAIAAVAIAGYGRAQVPGPTVDRGRQAFQACAACHSDKAGVSRIGPSLFGMLGKPAGRVQGFRYSPAMAKAAVRWDRKTLDAFIAKPKAVVPGNRMTYPGVSDPAKRKLIVDYIAGLR